MNPPGRPVPAHGWPAVALASEPEAPKGCGLGLLTDSRGQGRLIRPERTHTPHSRFLLRLPLAGWSALCSTEVSGTVWPGCKHPLGGRSSPGSPTAASQDPWVPRPPAEGPRMLGWYQTLPPPGPTCESGTWPRSRKPLPTLVFPQAPLPPGGVGGGAGRCVGRYRPPTRVQLLPRGRSSVAGKSRQALLCGEV